MTSYQFPSVDLNLPRDIILRTIRQACSEYGFFNLLNSSIQLEDINQVKEISKQFFSLSLEEKQKYPLKYNDGDLYLYGYACVGAESADVANVSLTGNTAPIDLMESFQVADVDKVENKYPNNEMKVILDEFYRKERALGITLLELIAESLNLPSNELIQYHFGERHRTILRVTRYPPLIECTTQRGSGVSRISPHKDLGTLTLLIQDNCGGLEVLGKKSLPTDEDIWLPVEPLEGSLVINVGNILMRWSNYKYRSSIHRVITTERSDYEERYSIIYFINPNDDTFVRPLPGTEESNEEPKFIPFLVEEYISCKLTQLFDPEARKEKGACEFDD